MARDRGEQVVEVMRDTAGKLPNRLHFLALDKLCFERLELGRVGDHRNQGDFAIFDLAPERDLQIPFFLIAFGAHHLGLVKASALQRIRQPIPDRTPEPADQVGKERAFPGLNRQQSARQLIGALDLAGLFHTQKRHRKIFQTFKITAGGWRFGGLVNRRQEILRPATGTCDDHHIDGHITVFCLDLMQFPGLRGSRGEKTIKRLHTLPRQGAHGVVHIKDGAAAACCKHGQGNLVRPAPRCCAFARLFNGPKKPIPGEFVDGNHVARVSGDHILARRIQPCGLGLQAEYQRAGIGDRLADDLFQHFAATIAKGLACRRVARQNLARGGRHKNGSIIVKNQVFEL